MNTESDELNELIETVEIIESVESIEPHPLLKQILECAILAAGEPVDISRFQQLFAEDERPSDDQIRTTLEELKSDLENRGLNLKEVASGYTLQIRSELQAYIGRLWDTRPPRYSRALLETLALIAYRQPITRAEIEEIRGVGIASTTFKILTDREWIRVVGHRDVPGRPGLYATTKQFLDYFNLKSLDELPSLAEITDILAAETEIAEAKAVTASVEETTTHIEATPVEA
ncbi:MAG TPA: SMC-Scp complex subunit ScpB [Gammaproteobacteria bacterium]|nr:SMC-Scp complex subunit ScpB [Gammaproteobacteria bacterium]